MTEKKKYTLEDENKLLKQALRESLQAEGDGCLIETLDELFDLKYDEWEASGHYQDWDKKLEICEQMTRRFYIDNKENIIENNGYAELNKYTFKDKNDWRNICKKLNEQHEYTVDLIKTINLYRIENELP